MNATAQAFKKLRLETGLCKPSIFIGLSPVFGCPGCFTGDCMHLLCINFAILFLELLRATIACDNLTDSRDSWPWAVFYQKAHLWESHGQEVADITPYIPGSFDRAPRNPADKLNSGYKAWELLLYVFGLGPYLFYNLLPDDYWRNFCMAAKAVRITLQHEITSEELRYADDLFCQFSDDYELLYVQRRMDRIHFVRPVIHGISHMAPETARIGPQMGISQWTMERVIGDLGREIRQHSNAFENLTQRGIRRCEVNVMKAIIPDLEPPENPLPSTALQIGNGFALLAATEAKPIHMITPAEKLAIDNFIKKIDPQLNPSSWYKLMRWARLRLPNGQVARSRWKEEKMKKDKIRMARNVKVSFQNDFLNIDIHHIHRLVKVILLHLQRFTITWSLQSMGPTITLLWLPSMDQRMKNFIKTLPRLTFQCNITATFQDMSRL